MQEDQPDSLTNVNESYSQMLERIRRNLGYLRQFRGLTVGQVAERMGYPTSSNVSNHESRGTGNLRILKKFSEVYSIPLHVLIGADIEGLLDSALGRAAESNPNSELVRILFRDKNVNESAKHKVAN